MESLGAAAAFQAVSTTAELGAVAALTKPTVPLKARFTRFALDSKDGETPNIPRCHHTLTIAFGKAYIFGGAQSPKGPLCGTEMHILTLPNVLHSPGPGYECIPAKAAKEGGSLPQPRRAHVARQTGDSVEIFGGTDEGGGVIDPAERWEFNTNTLKWIAASSKPVEETATAGNGAVRIGDYVYALSQDDDFTTTVQYRRFDAPQSEGWESNTAPRNPLTPGPSLRDGAVPVPITTGSGRNYLVVFFSGAAAGIWALQVHPSDSTLSHIKDSLRSTLGSPSELFQWESVEVLAPEVEVGDGGKSLPGPLEGYAAAGLRKAEVLVWGGVDAHGEVCGEGWVVGFE